MKLLAPALVASLVAVVGCNKQSAPPAAAAGGAPQGTPVVAASATATDVPLYLDEIGKTTASEAVTVTPRIGGQVFERHFEDGADVKKDHVLFVLDKAPSEATLAAAQAALAQAKASLGFANIELERYSAVAGTQAISKTDFDTKKNAVDVANAQVQAAEAAVRTAQINLDFCTIKSPIDGRASSRMVDVGNVVKENESALLSIQKIDPIYADFTVNEGQVAQVRQYMASGQLKTMVKLPTDTDAGREGTLTFLDNSVQASTGTIRLRATLKNDDHHLWPGQFVNVRLILTTLKDAVVIPATATQVSQQGLFVFKVNDDDKSPTHMSVSQQMVKLGQQQADRIVINDGLKAGDRVVVSGQMMLQPGSAVMVLPPQGAAPGGPPGAKPTSAPSENKQAAADSQRGAS